MGKDVYRWRKRVTGNGTGSPTVILKLVMQHKLIVLSTASRQFEGPFVLISLRPVLGIVAANVMATVLIIM